MPSLDHAAEPTPASGVVPLGRACERLPGGHRVPLPDPRRADRARLQREVEVATASPIVDAILDASDSILLVLNPERQIVAYNARLPERRAQGPRQARQVRDARGLRPGEALGCVNASGPGGCGAAPECASCGALGAILASQGRQRPVEAECSIRSEEDAAAWEFNARAAPVRIEDCTFTVLSLRDVSAEKRREALEQVFFHDVLNTVTGLRSWSAVLRRTDDPRRAAERIEALSRQIDREIQQQRALLAAENGTLTPELAPLRAADALEDLRSTFAEHPLARDRRLELECDDPELVLVTDRALVVRTLVNAVANGLEATAPGGAVRLSAARADHGDERGVRFDVRSAAVMPPEVQARVFHRSFSTKAARGRGLGTYSMKLFGERCLGGRVTFVSRADVGTVFSLWLPTRSDSR